MNQELKHRLIGAVVITALAAIFIPMLFDDPIDNTGQLVSEMTVPEKPDNNAGSSSNKSPASIGEVLETPSEDAGQASNDEDLTTETDNIGNTTVDRFGQGHSEDVPPAGSEEYVEEEMAPASDNAVSKLDEGSPALDTGMVEQTDQPSTTGNATASENYQQPAARKSTGAPAYEKKPSTDAATKNSGTTAQQQSAPGKNLTSAPATESKKTGSGTKGAPPAANKALVRWYLQAGSFGRKDNASALFDRLRKQGLPVILETVRGEKGELYRLKVGPELSRKRAGDIKAKLEKQKIKTLMISE